MTMFTVMYKSKGPRTGKVGLVARTVFDIQIINGVTQFLIYEYGSWEWVSTLECEPVNMKTAPDNLYYTISPTPMECK